MKTSTLFALTTLFTSLAIAQTTVPRVPVYEIFSSSTCGPCAPANVHMSPILENRINEIAVIKYQMSWPGTGDPYFTSEANTRRNYYGINSVPAFMRNAVSFTPYSAFNDASIEADLALQSGMKMELRYRVDADSQLVRVRARIEALVDYTDGGQRILIPIVERKTTKNKKSNGESEFHNVFKKMLPTATGQMVIGNITAGTVIEIDTFYKFNGSYRLPANAGDPINHAIEHSVEEFDDLHVVMFMQSMSTSKQIYQAAVGERSKTENDFLREWGTDPEPPLSVEESFTFGLRVYPNPASDKVYLDAKSNDIQLVRIIDMSGRVLIESRADGSGLREISVSSLSSGVYNLQVQTKNSLEQQLIFIKK